MAATVSLREAEEGVATGAAIVFFDFTVLLDCGFTGVAISTAIASAFTSGLR